MDIVIERGMSIAGAEVKAGATVEDADFRGLRKLAKAAGHCFAGGAVLYDGETCVGFWRKSLRPAAAFALGNAAAG